MMDILCRCGHPLKYHFWDSVINGSCHLTKRGTFTNTSRVDEYVDNCTHYTPDNLLSIEQEAKKRNLI